MITLHESDITSFPRDNGIGMLRDVIRAYAEEELNGMFEFYMEYDSEGHLVDELKEERIIKAKAQDKLGYQLFRIYSITKNHENDNLIIRAQHITYDLADNFVEKLEANNLTKKQVMELIGSSTVLPHPFNITSPNTTTRSSTKLYRTNPLQMIGGMEGSILQIWGGQIERDNFNLILHDRRGSDDGVKVTYEKNITGLEATFDISNLVTRIFPFVYIEATDNEPSRLITVNGKYIDSPHINDYEKIYIKPIDYSNDERINMDGTDAQIRQQLTNIASQYFKETGNDKIKVDMEVQFEHLWETEEYKDLAVLELVGMGDTVTIEHSRLKVDATAIVNYIRYDCIAEKNEEVRLGSVKARLTDNVNRVVDVAEKVEQAQQTANQAIRAANGKNTIYYGPDEPEGGIEGDLWFRVVDGEYTRTYRHDGIQWQLVLSVDVRDAMDEAQQAKDDAQQAVERANQATQQATNAINQAQTAFDEAQAALSTANNALTQANSAFSLANDAFSEVESLSTIVDENTGEISMIKQSVIGLQMQVSDNAGNISSLTQIAQGLQTQVTDIEGNVSTLQQTAQGLQSSVTNLQYELDNLEIGGRNLLRNSHFNGLSYWVGNQTATLTIENGYLKVIFGETRSTPGLKYIPQVTLDKGFYTASAKVNVENLSQPLTFYVLPNYRGTQVLEGGETGWRIITWTFEVTANQDTGIFYLLSQNTSSTDYMLVEWIKLEKGNKATDWTPAPEDIDHQFSVITQTIDGITTRVGDAEGNISVLQQTSSSLAARLTDAEGNITTLTATVNGLQTTVSNVQGDVSSVTQLANALQTRMTNAEGDISTLTQTASSLQSTVSSLQDEWDNLEIGGRNLIYYDRIGVHGSATYDKSQYVSQGIISLTINNLFDGVYITANGLEPNTDYIFSYKYKKISGTLVSFGGHVDTATWGTTTAYVDGIRKGNYSNPDSVFVADDESIHKVIVYIKTASTINETHKIYIQPNRGFATPVSVEIYDWKLEKGNKATDWTPAPEDMATQSQITQLSDAINLRVMKGDVINQINISDESILIDGKRIHITGQTTIDDASIDGAKIKDASIGNAQIGYIDAAKITSGELNTNNITIRGGNSQDYTFIRGSLIESQGRYTRTWRGNTTTRVIQTIISDGGITFHNRQDYRSLYYSDFGISTFKDGDGEGTSSGTLQFFDTTHTPGGYRGVTLVSNTGVVALETRTSAQDILLKSSANVRVDAVGVLKVNTYTESHILMPREASNLYLGFENEVRFTNRLFYNDGNTTYNRFRGSIGFVHGIATNTFGSNPAVNLNLATPSGEVRTIRDIENTTNPTYAPLRTGRLHTNEIQPNGGSKTIFYSGIDVRGNIVLPTNEMLQTTAGYLTLRAGSGYVFLQTDYEVRAVKPNTTDNYVAVRASSFNEASSRDYKTNIEEYTDSALEIIKSLTVVSYNLKDDIENGIIDKKIGFISEDSPAIATADGKAIQMYQLSAYNTKAIQELDMKFTNLEDEINWLKIENQYLKQKVKQLEEMIA